MVNQYLAVCQGGSALPVTYKEAKEMYLADSSLIILKQFGATLEKSSGWRQVRFVMIEEEA